MHRGLSPRLQRDHVLRQQARGAGHSCSKTFVHFTVLFQLLLRMGEGTAGSSGTASFLLHVSAHVRLVFAVLWWLLRVGTLLAVVLNEVH